MNLRTTSAANLCRHAVEASWLGAVVASPLFFSPLASRETDKATLISALACAGGIAWLLKTFLERHSPAPGLHPARQSVWRTPLTAPLLLLVLSSVVSTLFSIAPRMSVWGSYERGQGLIALGGYLTFFVLIRQELRTQPQWERLRFAMLMTSVPVSVYAIVQRFGRDPFSFSSRFLDRPSSTMGNPIFLAAYLVLLVPLTFVQIWESVSNVRAGRSRWTSTLPGCLVLALQLAAVAIAKSRGPWLGLVAATFVFLLLLFVTGHRRGKASSKDLWPLVILGALVLVPGLWMLPRLFQRSQITVAASADAVTDPTARVRALIWQGATELLRPHAPLPAADQSDDRFNVARPLVGYGPDSMVLAYFRYQPKQLPMERSNAAIGRSHNEVFDRLIFTGALGLAAYILWIGSVLYHGLKSVHLIDGPADRRRFVAWIAVAAVAGALACRLAGMSYLLGPVVGLSLIAGALGYVALRALLGSKPVAVMDGRERLLVLALLSALVGHFVETQVGIAVSVTQIYAFVLAGALVAAGVTSSAADSPPARHSRASESGDAAKPWQKSATVGSPIGIHWAPVLVRAGIVALILLLLDWDFINVEARSGGPAAVFAKAWVTYATPDHRSTTGVTALWLVLATLSIGLLLTASETRSTRLSRQAGALLVGAGGAAWLLFGLLLATTASSPYTATALWVAAARFATHITAFYVALGLLVALLVTALSLERAESTERNSSKHGRRLAPTAVTALVLVVAAAYATYQVAIRPARAVVFQKVAESLSAQQKWSEATYFHERAVESAPHEDYYQFSLAQAIIQRSKTKKKTGETLADLDAAERIIRETLAINRFNPIHLRSLAACLVARAEISSESGSREALARNASSYYRRAQDMMPISTDLLREWAHAASLARELDTARDLYRKSLAIDAKDPRSYIGLANLDSAEGNLSEALRSYTAAAALDAKHFDARARRAELLEQLGRHSEAIVANQEALAVRPDDLKTLVGLARMYERVGDYRGAVASAERAYGLMPESLRQAYRDTVARLRRRLQERPESSVTPERRGA